MLALSSERIFGILDATKNLGVFSPNWIIEIKFSIGVKEHVHLGSETQYIRVFNKRDQG